MAAMSNYLETAIVNAVLRNTAYTSPTTVYVALFTTDPTDANTGTEVSAAGYARQSAAFAAPTNGATSNTADVTFGPAGASWGTVTHIGVYDAATAGNLLFHGALTESKLVNNNDTTKISAGELDITVL